MARRWLDAETAADLGKLDAEAIRRVREEVWPAVRNADELADAIATLAFLAEDELKPDWRAYTDELAQARRATRFGPGIWIAAERLPEFEALLPGASFVPVIEAPREYRKPWTREDALVEIVRDRLQGLGPVTLPALAAPLGLPLRELEAALARLEAEGSAMRGRFSPDARETEWCERRLLARIHRYTVHRLRAEIEPVEARDFLRFLFRWQRVAAEARVEGADALAAIVSQLEGFEAPAAAWETEILPARVNEYDPAWLDELSLAGRVVWTRLAGARPSGERAPSPVRTTPIALFARRNLGGWTALADAGEAATPSVRAREVADFIGAHGASFFDEIAAGTHLLRSQVEDALGELAALGLVNADSFGGLRALLVPSDRRPAVGTHKRRRRTALFGIEDAGRWALVRRAPRSTLLPEEGPSAKREGVVALDPDVVAHVAQVLLKRYGVVFWRLLGREAEWLPPWRELLRCYRRLEARGEIRGGRFVAGVSGEQFALPEAIGSLRDARRAERTGALVSLSAADPLNLVGILSPGARLPALTGNRVLYRDGVPIALLAGGEARFLEQLAPEAEWRARNALVRRQVPSILSFLG
jgi:ATP-dependent Lhr-like helicase